MGDIMHKTIGMFVTLALAAGAFGGVVSGAHAQDYWRHRGGGWHGNGWHNGNGGAFVAGAVAGGVVGSAIAAPSYGYAPAYGDGYYGAGPTVIIVQPPPPVVYVQPQPQVVYVHPGPRVYVEQPALVPPALVPNVGAEEYPDY
jgi:hypothetical protein